MIEEKKIRQWVDQELEGSDKYLLALTIRPGNAIHVILDGDHGITIDDCVRISRAVESKLDREQDDFELKVMSAGADQPLANIRQYRKNIGRTLGLQLVDGEEWQGELLEVSDESIRVRPAAGKKKTKEPIPERIVPFGEIRNAKVILSFKHKKNN